MYEKKKLEKKLKPVEAGERAQSLGFEMSLNTLIEPEYFNKRMQIFRKKWCVEM